MLTMAYIRRKRFEGQAGMAAWGEAARDGKNPRVSAGTMLAMMGGA